MGAVDPFLIAGIVVRIHWYAVFNCASDKGIGKWVSDFCACDWQVSFAAAILFINWPDTPLNTFEVRQDFRI